MPASREKRMYLSRQKYRKLWTIILKNPKQYVQNQGDYGGVKKFLLFK